MGGGRAGGLKVFIWKRGAICLSPPIRGEEKKTLKKVGLPPTLLLLTLHFLEGHFELYWPFCTDKHTHACTHTPCSHVHAHSSVPSLFKLLELELIAATWAGKTDARGVAGG